MRTISVCRKCPNYKVLGNPIDHTGARDQMKCYVGDKLLVAGETYVVARKYIDRELPEDCPYILEQKVTSENQCLNCEDYKLLLAKCIIELESCEKTLMRHTEQSIKPFIEDIKKQMNIMKARMEKKCWGKHWDEND